MVERRKELDRRYRRKKAMRKLKAKLVEATGADREKILYKIHRLSPFWTEASLTKNNLGQAGVPVAGQAAAPAGEAPAPRPKAPPKPKVPPKA